MSTDQTPALARATEALSTHGERVASGPERGTPSAYARAVVSAALHDPDDPDWLARHLAERDGCENVFGDVPAFLTGSIEKIRNDYRRQATAFVAAILGEAS